MKSLSQLILLNIVKQAVINSCEICQTKLSAVCDSSKDVDAEQFYNAIREELKKVKGAFSLIGAVDLEGLADEIDSAIYELASSSCHGNVDLVKESVMSALITVPSFIMAAVESENISSDTLVTARRHIRGARNVPTDSLDKPVKISEIKYTLPPQFNKSIEEKARKNTLLACKKKYTKVLLSWLSSGFNKADAVQIKKVCNGIRVTVLDSRLATFFWFMEGLCELLAESDSVDPKAHVAELRQAGVVLDQVVELGTNDANGYVSDATVLKTLNAVIASDSKKGQIAEIKKKYAKSGQKYTVPFEPGTITLGEILPRLIESVDSSKIYLEKSEKASTADVFQFQFEGLCSCLATISATLQISNIKDFASLEKMVTSANRAALSVTNIESFQQRAGEEIRNGLLAAEKELATFRENKVIRKLFEGKVDPLAVQALLEESVMELVGASKTISLHINAASAPSELQASADRLLHVANNLNFIHSKRPSALLFAAVNEIMAVSEMDAIVLTESFKAAIVAITAVVMYMESILDDYSAADDLLEQAEHELLKVDVNITDSIPARSISSASGDSENGGTEVDSFVSEVTELLPKIYRWSEALAWEDKEQLAEVITALTQIRVGAEFVSCDKLARLTGVVAELAESYLAIFNYEDLDDFNHLTVIRTALAKISELLEEYVSKREITIYFSDVEQSVRAATNSLIPADKSQDTGSNFTYIMPADAQDPAEAEATDVEYDPILIELYTQELNRRHDQIMEACKKRSAAHNLEPLIRHIHTLKGSASSAELDDLADVYRPIEDYLTECSKVNLQVNEALFECIPEALAVTKKYLEGLSEPKPLLEKDTIISKIQSVCIHAEHKSQDYDSHIAAAIKSEAGVNDDQSAELEEESVVVAHPDSPTVEEEPDASSESVYDEDTLELFLDEAAEVMPKLRDLMGRWCGVDGNSVKAITADIKRALHTLKGSANLANAVAIGAIAHGMEDIFESIYTGIIKKDADAEALLSAAVDAIGEGVKSAENDERYSVAKGLENCISNAIESNVIDLRQISPNNDQKPSKECSRKDKKHSKHNGDVKNKIPPQTSLKPTPEVQDKNVVATTEDVAKQKNNDVVKYIESSIRKKKRKINSQKRRKNPKVKIEQKVLDTLIDSSNEMVAEFNRLGVIQDEHERKLKSTQISMTSIHGIMAELESHLRAAINSDLVGQNSQDETLGLERYLPVSQTATRLAEYLDNLEEDLILISDEFESLQKRWQGQEVLAKSIQDKSISSRLVELNNMNPNFKTAVMQTAEKVGKISEFKLLGGNTSIDKNILDSITDPIMHIIRNAVDHGLESPGDREKAGKKPTGCIAISASQDAKNITIRIEDDGAGIDIEKVKAKAVQRGIISLSDNLSNKEIFQLITKPGFSTAESVTNISGRGIGMDIVRTMVEGLGGRLSIESVPGKYSAFIIDLPSSIGTNRALLCRCGSMHYAVPVASITTVDYVDYRDLKLARAELERPVINHEGENYDLLHIADVIAVPDDRDKNRFGLVPVVIVKTKDLKLCIEVDDIVDMLEIYVNRLPPIMEKVAGIQGYTELADGQVAFIVDFVELARNNLKQSKKGFITRQNKVRYIKKAEKRTAMVVDDSTAMRRYSKKVLEKAGYTVVEATDGLHGLDQLRANDNPSLIVLDVEMPGLGGFEFARAVRDSDQTADIPIIMATSRSGEKFEEHAKKVGVDVFINKPFEETKLLEAVNIVMGQEMVR